MRHTWCSSVITPAIKPGQDTIPLPDYPIAVGNYESLMIPLFSRASCDLLELLWVLLFRAWSDLSFFPVYSFPVCLACSLQCNCFSGAQPLWISWSICHFTCNASQPSATTSSLLPFFFFLWDIILSVNTPRTVLASVPAFLGSKYQNLKLNSFNLKERLVSLFGPAERHFDRCKLGKRSGYFAVVPNEPSVEAGEAQEPLKLLSVIQNLRSVLSEKENHKIKQQQCKYHSQRTGMQLLG